MDINKWTKMVMSLPREAFHQWIVSDIAQTEAFGHLMTTGASDLSVKEASYVRCALSQVFGIEPATEELDIIAALIVARSVQLT